MKTEQIELELRVKETGYETFTKVRVPAGTTAADLLKTIKAEDLVRNTVMPFSGRIMNEEQATGTLKSGMYTVYGPLGIEREIGKRVRQRYALEK
jgi:hypothetical protein